MSLDPYSNRSRSSGWPLVALGVIAIAAGLFHYSGATVAFGIVLVATPLGTLYLLRRALRGLSIRRDAPDTAFEGDDVDITLSIENRSWLPIFQPELSDCFGPEQHDKKVVIFPERLRPGERLELGYVGTCIHRRGIYRIGPLTASISDPFGWFRLEKTLLDDDTRIKVYPQVVQAGTRDELGRFVADIASELNSKRIGGSEEFFSVREYRSGDPLRRVHWRLTARTGFPVVREFARQARGDLCIVIDRSRDALVGVGRGSSLEHAVKITAALSSHALSRGHRVEVIAGGESSLRAPPGGGRDYLQVVLELLVTLRPNDDVDLVARLEQYRESLRPGSVLLLMVSPYLYGNRRFLDMLTAIRRRGIHISAVVFDVETFRNLWSRDCGIDDSRHYATTLARVGIRPFVLRCAADLRAVFVEGSA